MILFYTDPLMMGSYRGYGRKPRNYKWAIFSVILMGILIVLVLFLFLYVRAKPHKVIAKPLNISIILNNKDYLTTLRLTQKYLKQTPFKIQYLLNQGLAAYHLSELTQDQEKKQKWLNQSISCFRKILVFNISSLEENNLIQYLLAQDYLSKGFYYSDLAYYYFYKVYQNYTQNISLKQLQYNIGLTQIIKGQALKAQEWIEKVGAAQWTGKQVFHIAQQMLYQKQPVLAQKYTQLALKKFKWTHSNQQMIAIYLFWGQYWYKQGQWGKAAYYYQKALRLDATNRILYNKWHWYVYMAHRERELIQP